MRINAAIAIGALCAAFAAGYYVAQHKPIQPPASTETRDQSKAARDQFANTLIEIRAQVLSGGITSHEFSRLAKQFRIASDRYLLSTKTLPHTDMLDSKKLCLSDVRELMDKVELSSEFYEICKSNCLDRNMASIKDVAAARGKLSECLDMFMQ